MSNIIKKKTFVIIHLLIMVSMLFSCSHPIEFFEKKEKLIYQDNTYISYDFNTTLTYWYPYLSTDQLEKVDTTKFELSSWALRPIYVTNEEVPNFVIISFDKENISPGWAYSYINSDLELSSVFDTSFGSVYFDDYAYNKTLDGIKKLDNLPSGIKFTDMIEEPTSELSINVNHTSDYYGTLYCSHPDIDYLVCKFNIMLVDGKYYLVAYHEPLEETYYLFNQDLLK